MSKSPDPVVEHLQYLSAERGQHAPDRGALAALRTSLSKDQPLDALRVVLPTLRIPAGVSAAMRRSIEDAAVLLAQLYALHPVSSELTLAGALRRVMGERDSESIEARFRALLASGRSELATHLRHAVTLVGASGVGIDWADLHLSIRYWEDLERRRQRAWARDFWARDADDEAEINENAATAQT